VVIYYLQHLVMWYAMGVSDHTLDLLIDHLSARYGLADDAHENC